MTFSAACDKLPNARFLTHLCFIISDPPENVRISVSKASACKDDVISFTCSAYSRPAVQTYQLFENDTLVSDFSDSGLWNRGMSSKGVFVYKCVANNSGGTGSSKSVIVNVNGKQQLSILQLDLLLICGALTQ